MSIKAIDHVAITVPDIEQATAFFSRAFGARIVLEGLSLGDEPCAGEGAELAFGMPRGGRIVARRVLNMGGHANVELFQFEGMEHQRPPHTYDYGIQHFAVQTDNLQKTAADFLRAGGRLYQSEEFAHAVLEGMGPAQGWLYGETPWGSVIEMVTFREA